MGKYSLLEKAIDKFFQLASTENVPGVLAIILALAIFTVTLIALFRTCT